MNGYFNRVRGEVEEMSAEYCSETLPVEEASLWLEGARTNNFIPSSTFVQLTSRHKNLESPVRQVTPTARQTLQYRSPPCRIYPSKVFLE
jgi:hypothetical protein